MNGSVRNALRIAALAATACISSCAVEQAPRETTGVASDSLVPCLSTDESLSYPSSYILKNINGTPLTSNQDITVPLQAAIDARSLTTTPTAPVIVIPPGTFRISSTIRIRASWSISIVGASVAGAGLPTIRWAGAADDDMFLIDWSWWTRFNRLVIDGNNVARIGLHYMESKQRFDVNPTTNLMTSSFPVLDGTPMMPVAPAPSGLSTSGIYYVRTTATPGTYYLAPSATCTSCAIDLVDAGPAFFIIGSGFNSYDHEITDVTIQSLRYGVVGGVYTMDYDGNYPGHAACSSDGFDGNGHPDCVPLGEPGLNDIGSDVGTVNIRRSTFSRISQQGVVANTYNAIDWGIFDSTFESSKIGVFIGVGQGSIFNSRFQFNTTRDILVAGMPYGMIRDNVSVGSKQFLRTEYGTNSISVINNKVDNSSPPGAAAPAMELRNRTITLIDNRIKRSTVATTPPAVAFVDNAGVKALDIVDGGNITQPALVFPSAPVARRVNIAPNTSTTVTVSMPAKPPVAPWLNRPTTEVTPNGTGQCCILGTCAECRTLLASPADGSAVHFAAGIYKLNEPITIPANRNVLLYGDGLATQFYWTRNNTTYVAPGTVGQTATVFFDLVGSSRAGIREMALFLENNLAPDRGLAGGISIRSADDLGNRVFVDQTKITGGAKYGVDVNGFDRLATRVDMVAIGPAEIPIRAKGKGAGKADGSNATKGVLAFAGEYMALGDAFRVENFGKLVSQGADLEGITQGALVTGAGFLTVSSSRIYAGNAAYLGCLYNLPVPYAQHGNYEIASSFDGRASFVDMWTTGRIVGNALPVSAGKLLAINVSNNFIHEPDPNVPDPIVCGGHFFAPPESVYTYPPATSCPYAGGPADPDPGICPFTSLSSTAVTAGTQATLNGRFLHADNVCTVPCANEANASATTFAATMLADLRAANSSAVPATCGPTDVRIRRVVAGGRAVGYNVGGTGYTDWRLLEFGVRVQ